MDTQKFLNDHEENNDFTQAQNVIFNSVVSGHLGARGQLKPRDVSDYWKVIVPSDGILQVSVITSKKLNLYGGVFVYNSDKRKIYWSAHSPDKSMEHKCKVKAGVHYIKIEKDGRGFYWGSYQMVVRHISKEGVLSKSTGKDKDSKETEQQKPIKDTIRSSLSVDPSGVWDTNQENSRMKLMQRSGDHFVGTYSLDNGKIWGVLNGNIFTGYWTENDSNVKCDRAINGNYHWGKVRFEFKQDTFTGAWGYCEKAPDHSWSGRRVR